MKRRRAEKRRIMAMLDNTIDVGQRHGETPTRFVREAAGDDLVRIVSQLERDVERFGSRVRSHRQLIEHHAIRVGPSAGDQINRDSKWVSDEAAHVAMKARRALDALHHLAQLGEHAAVDSVDF
jgi:hypothetical protein